MELDLNFRYDETSERVTREHIERVMPYFVKFKKEFDTGTETHGLTLTKELLRASIDGHLAAYINKLISEKYENTPFYLKPIVSESVSALIANIEHSFAEIISKSKADPIFYKELPPRFRSQYVLIDFLQIEDIGIDAFIEIIKDDFYIKYESVEDFRFAQEVEELANHYNKVTSKMRNLDRLMADRVLFTKDTDGVLHPRKDNLLRYQSIYRDQIIVQPNANEL